MLNPKALQLATLIAEEFAHLLVDREENVVTLEDTTGERFIITVQSVFTPTIEARPLPGGDDVSVE
jgi:hypothetical protein